MPGSRLLWLMQIANNALSGLQLRVRFGSGICAGILRYACRSLCSASDERTRQEPASHCSSYLHEKMLTTTTLMFPIAIGLNYTQSVVTGQTLIIWSSDAFLLLASKPSMHYLQSFVERATACGRSTCLQHRLLVRVAPCVGS